MGTCLSKKKDSSNPSNVAGSKSFFTAPSQSNNVVTVTKLELNLKKERKTVEEKQQNQLAHEKDEGQVKKEIFIIKHRKSHDGNIRERNSKIQPLTSQNNVQPQQNNGSPSASTSSTNEASEKSMAGNNSNNNNMTAPSTPNMVMVRSSSCTKEEVDAILIQCGRLSRSPSSRAASSSGGRKYSDSKRSFDFDHCDSNETISADSDPKRVIDEDHDDGKSSHHQHWQRHRHRQSPKKRGSSPSSQGRRRTPSREREQQQQRSSSRERRVSRSPGKRSSETNNSNNNIGSIRPGKMVSVPATVTSLVMDKNNNGGGVIESASIKRVSVKRNGVGVGDGLRSAASPRSQSPASANGNANQPCSPYRRNPLSDIDPCSLAYPQSNTNNSSNNVQNKAKWRETEANQKLNADVNENSKNRISRRVALEEGEIGDCKIKEQQEEEINVLCSMIDNVAVKNVIQSSADNLKQQPQTLTKSRSSRRSRDLDLNPESLLNPTQTYTSLLLEDIHNFHQKTTQQQLPPCLTKACSILESVADLNSTTSSNFSDNQRSPPTYQSLRNNNEHNHYGKRVQLPSTKDHPFVGSEVVMSDDMMEPSLHKYVTVKRGGIVDMEDQESSGSNSFIATSNGQNHLRDISSSWEPNSADSTDSWTSRLHSREDLEGGNDMKTLSSKRRECDHQHSNGIGRGRLGSKGVVIAASST
ncbi:hypothetical protein TanjilG_32614 [Lupinus angustifolius]|uniref:Uncharacterized protein n=1 Tax=Lupinus angustifolius TaxID=3871 RepID=A0A4P1R843_LUPAN|nr:PREDICTED: uncharacterized protein At1g65710-like [Lupinus angustifolius]OIW04422.1 hypothetical protein TanjilG_32614 [Lupinus angustifolius]